MGRRGLTTPRAGQLLVGRQGRAGGQVTGQRGALASAQEEQALPAGEGAPAGRGLRMLQYRLQSLVVMV